MMKSKKLCMKNTINKIIALLSAAVIFGANTYAADFVPAPEFENFEAAQIFSGMRESIQLFSDEYTAPKMDFSRLNGSLTIEVSGDLAAGAVLFIGEYSQDGDLLKTHMINDIQSANTVSVSGAYERAYLWNFAKMTPLCGSITTKADYEIIEGVEGEWEVSADGHTLYKYTGSSKDVVIPNSYLGKRIYAIENSPAINSSTFSNYSAFRSCNLFGGKSDITSIKIPEGIKIIGSLAFMGCTKITGDASLPSTAYVMGDYAFYDCQNMTGQVDLSKFILIGSRAYYNCYKITGGLDLSSLRYNIGINTFASCTSLNGELKLPEGITSIGASAFYECKGLTGELKLPETLTSIGASAFYKCSGLSGALNIPEGIERIESFTFSNDSGFTSLTLPSTLKYIGIAAFQLNSKLANKLVLPEGLEHIGDFAFSHTKFSNTSLTIPNSVKTIGGDYRVTENTGWGGHVFYDSFKKTTEFISDGEYFKSVDGVLYSKDMTRLVMYPPAKADTSYTVPEGVTQLDEMSFGYSKVKNITLPDSFVISENVPANIINDMANNLAVALYHNNAIQNIYFNETNPNYISVDGIVYSKDLKELWYVPTNKTGIITVLDGTEKIRKGAFYIEYDSGEKYTGVHIPASVTEINQENLKSINKRPLANITVDENNQYYTVTDGKLTAK